MQEEGPIKRRKLALGATKASCPTSHSASISKEVAFRRRRQIIERVTKGRKLCTMVSKTGLWILLLHKIWDYQKMSDENVKEALEQLRADPHTGDLLPVLDEQINILVHEGRTNLSLFLTSLESQSLIPSDEASELRVKFGLDSISYNPFPIFFIGVLNHRLQGTILESSIDADVNGLTTLLHQLFNKPDSVSNSDSIMIGDAVESPLGSLDRLRPEGWLDM